jgi:hypothetical protein
MNFLDAAYIATWLIHIAYLTTLVGRFKKLRQEIGQLPRK